jgi:hypothetical protein
MAGKHGIFFNKRVHAKLESIYGLFGLNTGNSQQGTEWAGGRFDTGNSVCPDIVYGLSAPQALIDMSGFNAIPKYNGTLLRAYLFDLSVCVQGPTAWLGATNLDICDSSNNIIVGLPVASLRPWASYRFPLSGKYKLAVALTVTGSASTVTAVNFASTPFVAQATNSLVAAYIKCTSTGTGTAANLGQVRRITAHTTGQATLNEALPIAPAANDTFEIYQHQGVATMSATVCTANDTIAAGAAPSLYVSLLTGTGAGQFRSVTSQSSSALTVPTLGTAGDTTTTFTVDNMPGFFGADDFANLTNFAQITNVGGGLYANVVGTGSAGSPIRISGEYVWGQ